MEVTNVGSGTIEITATYEEIGKIALSLDNYAMSKDDDRLRQLANQLLNPKVGRKQ